MDKSRNFRVVEINSTMSSDLVTRLLKEISDHAKAAGKTKPVSVVSFVKN